MANDEIIIVRCMTVASEPETPIPSTVMSCYHCGSDVWLSYETADQIDGLLAKGAQGTVLMCENCPPPVGAADHCRQVILSPGQIERLQEKGMTNTEIAHLTALMIVAEGQRPDTTWDRIKAEPDTPLARHYTNVFASLARQLVAHASRN